MISNAMLHSIDEKGEVQVSMDIFYLGGFKIQMETEAKIELPRVKPFHIPLILAVVLKKMTGKVFNSFFIFRCCLKLSHRLVTDSG